MYDLCAVVHKAQTEVITIATDDVSKVFDNLTDTYATKVIDSVHKQRRVRRKRQKEHEERVYQTWKKPIDLLQGLIEFCIFVGEKKRRELRQKNRYSIKLAALTQIHARSILLSNEIVTLIVGGYPDGAHARWRSLYEVEVIGGFLETQDESVSERFLHHKTMRDYKKMQSYQKYCPRLGYEPYSEQEMKQMQLKHDLMIAKYGKEYEYTRGWEWIPPKIINRSVHGLAEYVGVDHYKPFYDFTSDKIHGGPRGFDYMGLPSYLRNSILLTGPSIFGMADPLHCTAISLVRATLCFISQDVSHSNIAEMKALTKIVDEIGQSALKIHQSLERDNRNR